MSSDTNTPGTLQNSARSCVDAALASVQSWNICHRCITSLAQCPYYNLALPGDVEYDYEDISLDQLQLSADAGCGICFALSGGITQRIETEAKAGNRALGNMLQSIQVLFKGEQAKELVIDVTANGDEGFIIDFDILADIHHVLGWTLRDYSD